ncbi:hypothetical protein [Ruegeria sp. SCP11]|uniref:hypothetical protein n=1 Tax=Ruegeria sp. SCP11 TaxID=3141378 RepID=UPI00333B83F9
MRITKIDDTEFISNFVGDGYAMTYGRQVKLYHRLVRLADEDGNSGVGEIARPAV